MGDVAIVHTHGPKPEMSLCAIEYLNKRVKDKRNWEPWQVLTMKDALLQHCDIQVALYVDEVLKIMAGAFKVHPFGTAGLCRPLCGCCNWELPAPKPQGLPACTDATVFSAAQLTSAPVDGMPLQADGGEMYRWVLKEQEHLCPGSCWQAAKEPQGKAKKRRGVVPHSQQ